MVYFCFNLSIAYGVAIMPEYSGHLIKNLTQKSYNSIIISEKDSRAKFHSYVFL